MKVTHPKALKQLLEQGILATLRTYPYMEGQKVYIRFPDDEEKCKWRQRAAEVIEVIEHPSRWDLELHLDKSGFSSVDEWWREAKRLHRREPRFLVVVKVNHRKR